MAKKMSVAEMLAAARAEKSGGTPPAEASSAEVPASSAPEAAAPAESAPAAPPATSKPASAKPASAMSVAEILAAARAKKGAAEAAPAAAKPTPAPKAASPKAPAATAKTNGETAAAVPTGPKDTASILAAARKGAKPGPMTKAEAAAQGKLEPVAKKKVEVPPMPAKPAYAKPQAAAEAQSRRSFLAATTGFLIGSPLAIGFTTLAITHLMWLLGLARFMFPNVLIEPPTRFKVGFADGLAPGQVETKFIPQFGVWIVKNEYEGQSMIYALKAVCTHLGCTPNWLEAEQKFKCPCHGSGFYKDGINFEGPAPRPLERYAISVADDGQLQVDKSRTFNQELGQWSDPASFVSV
jgi:cytochrome b6-f complex iron-sulfur subunit